MASKTAARSGTRTSRSKTTSRSSGSRSARPAPARKKASRPAKRHNRSLLVAAGIPQAWLQRVRNSLRTCGPEFGAGRMLEDYEKKVYGAG